MEGFYGYRIPKWVNFTNCHPLSHKLHSLSHVHIPRSMKTPVLILFMQEHLWVPERKGNPSNQALILSLGILFPGDRKLDSGQLLYSLYKSMVVTGMSFAWVSLITDSMLWLRSILMVTLLPCFGDSRIAILSHRIEITFECFLHNAKAPLNLVYRPLEKSKGPVKRNVIRTFEGK